MHDCKAYMIERELYKSNPGRRSEKRGYKKTFSNFELIRNALSELNERTERCHQESRIRRQNSRSPPAVVHGSPPTLLRLNQTSKNEVNRLWRSKSRSPCLSKRNFKKSPLPQKYRPIKNRPGTCCPGKSITPALRQRDRCQSMPAQVQRARLGNNKSKERSKTKGFSFTKSNEPPPLTVGGRERAFSPSPQSNLTSNKRIDAFCCTRNKSPPTHTSICAKTKPPSFQIKRRRRSASKNTQMPKGPRKRPSQTNKTTSKLSESNNLGSKKKSSVNDRSGEQQIFKSRKEQLSRCKSADSEYNRCCCCTAEGNIDKVKLLTSEGCSNNNHGYLHSRRDPGLDSFPYFNRHDTYESPFRYTWRRSRSAGYSPHYSYAYSQPPQDPTRLITARELTDYYLHKNTAEYIPVESENAMKDRLMNSAVDLKLREIRMQATKKMQKKEFELLEKYMYLQPPMSTMIKRSFSADANLSHFRPSQNFYHSEQPYTSQELKSVSNYSNNYFDRSKNDVGSLRASHDRRSHSTDYSCNNRYESSLDEIYQGRAGFSQRLKYASDQLNNETFYSGLRRHDLTTKKKALISQRNDTVSDRGSFFKTQKNGPFYHSNHFPSQSVYKDTTGSNYSFWTSGFQNVDPSNNRNQNKQIPTSFEASSCFQKPHIDQMPSYTKTRNDSMRSSSSKFSNNSNSTSSDLNFSNFNPRIPFSKRPWTDFLSPDAYLHLVTDPHFGTSTSKDYITSSLGSKSSYRKETNEVDPMQEIMKSNLPMNYSDCRFKPFHRPGSWESKYNCGGYNTTNNLSDEAKMPSIEMTKFFKSPPVPSTWQSKYIYGDYNRTQNSLTNDSLIENVRGDKMGYFLKSLPIPGSSNGSHYKSGIYNAKTNLNATASPGNDCTDIGRSSYLKLADDILSKYNVEAKPVRKTSESKCSDTGCNFKQSEGKSMHADANNSHIKRMPSSSSCDISAKCSATVSMDASIQKAMERLCTVDSMILKSSGGQCGTVNVT